MSYAAAKTQLSGAFAVSAHPKVSVCMVTYQHAPYIGQAIESVMAQQVDFSVELVIGEDCSPDNTREIIEGFQQRYPGRIRLVTGEHNVGAQPNFIRTYQACRGQYIAMLEGDDYWVDPHKLRDQVALLDQEPCAVLCFADCAAVNARGQVTNELFVPSAYRRNLSAQELVRDFCPPTLTVLFRNHLLPSLPDSFAVICNGDYFLFSMLSDFGGAVFVPRVVAHYRQHDGGVWSSQTLERKYRNNLNTRRALLQYFGSRNHAEIMLAVNWYYVQLLTMLRQQKRWGEFWRMYEEFTWLSIKALNKELPGFTLRLLTGRLKSSILTPTPTPANLSDPYSR